MVKSYHLEKIEAYRGLFMADPLIAARVSPELSARFDELCGIYKLSKTEMIRKMIATYPKDLAPIIKESYSTVDQFDAIMRKLTEIETAILMG